MVGRLDTVVGPLHDIVGGGWSTTTCYDDVVYHYNVPVTNANVKQNPLNLNHSRFDRDFKPDPKYSY